MGMRSAFSADALLMLRHVDAQEDFRIPQRHDLQHQRGLQNGFHAQGLSTLQTEVRIDNNGNAGNILIQAKRGVVPKTAPRELGEAAIWQNKCFKVTIATLLWLLFIVLHAVIIVTLLGLKWLPNYCEIISALTLFPLFIFIYCCHLKCIKKDSPFCECNCMECMSTNCLNIKSADLMFYLSFAFSAIVSAIVSKCYKDLIREKQYHEDDEDEKSCPTMYALTLMWVLTVGIARIKNISKWILKLFATNESTQGIIGEVVPSPHPTAPPFTPTMSRCRNSTIRREDQDRTALGTSTTQSVHTIANYQSDNLWQRVIRAVSQTS